MKRNSNSLKNLTYRIPKGHIPWNKGIKKPMGEVCNVDWGNTSMSKKFYKEKGFSAFSATGRDGFVENFEHDCNAIILSAIGARCGKCFWAEGKWTAIKNTIIIKVKDDKALDLRFLYYLVNDENFWNKSGAAQPFITLTSARKQQIPLPSIEIQKEIVKKLDQKKDIIDEANSLIEKVERERADAQEIFDELNYDLIELSDITELITKGTTPTTYGHDFTDKGVNFIKIENITTDGRIDFNSIMHISEKTNNFLKRSILKKNDVIMSIAGAIGRSAVINENILPANTNQAISIIRLKKGFLPEYISYLLNSNFVILQLDKFKVGVAQQNVNLKQVGQIKIPFLNIDEQKKVIFGKVEFPLNHIQPIGQ